MPRLNTRHGKAGSLRNFETNGCSPNVRSVVLNKKNSPVLNIGVIVAIFSYSGKIQ